MTPPAIRLPRVRAILLDSGPLGLASNPRSTPVRADKPHGITSLETLTDALAYLPLTTGMLRRAAAFWAQARRVGRSTADPHALDGDTILAAQAVSLGLQAGEVVIATTNIGHLSQFVTAKLWQDIP